MEYELKGNLIRKRNAIGIHYPVTDKIKALSFSDAFTKFYEKWDLCYPCKVTDERGDTMTSKAWFELERIRNQEWK